MLVVTLVLAAIGFGLLVIALMTGSIAWAWGCIAVCVVGGVILLASSLTSRDSRLRSNAPVGAPRRVRGTCEATSSTIHENDQHCLQWSSRVLFGRGQYL